MRLYLVASVGRFCHPFGCAQRTNIALNQFKSRGLYPNVAAPIFYVEGTYQHGGHVAWRGSLSRQGTTATIWYTLDGTDPRTSGASAAPGTEVKLVASKSPSGASPATVTPAVLRYTGPVTLTQSARVKARAFSGSTWSALNEAVYAVGPVAESLRVSEIMYHPLDTGNLNDPNTEYIELTNIGSQTINLSMVRFTNGIDCAFPSFELPGV